MGIHNSTMPMFLIVFNKFDMLNNVNVAVNFHLKIYITLTLCVHIYALQYK